MNKIEHIAHRTTIHQAWNEHNDKHKNKKRRNGELQ